MATTDKQNSKVSQVGEGARQIILASQSKQRFKLMATLGLEFVVKPAALDEESITASTQEKRAEQIARAKAESVSADYPQAIVIAADTYGLIQGQALEKPKSIAEAKQMLSLLSGQFMTALTGFCYLDEQNKIDHSLSKSISVKFRNLTNREIEDYVANNPVLTWSAAFSPSYDAGISLIAHVKGSLTAFTHGLPIEEVVYGLQKSGVIKN